jgi:RNA ligase (TIGR02306 family)
MEEIKRKLARTALITDVQPIPNADAIVCVTVDEGWKVVAKLDEFKIGDLCLFFEIDSFLPIEPRYEFLRKSCYKNTEIVIGDRIIKTEGFRLRTIKLRGQISQGLVMPMKDFPVLDGLVQYSVPGVDLTEQLSVLKYEKPIPASMGGKIAGNFPQIVRKTDQERLQNVYGKFKKYYSDHLFEVTLKLNGSSMTVYHNEGKIGVCSHNWEVTETEDNAFWRVARKYKIIEALESYLTANCDGLRNFAIQGELMGPAVQKNTEGLVELTMFVFDIWDIDKQQYLPHKARIDLISTLRGHGADIPHVPVLALDLEAFSELPSLDKFLEFANQPSLNAPVAEGVVFKSVNDPEVSFKVINNEYLLKEKD